MPLTDNRFDLPMGPMPGPDGGLDVVNPANGEKIGVVRAMDSAETRAAIAAAEDAFIKWRKLTGKERGAVLSRWHSLIVQNRDQLAQLITLENGKPLAEAQGEITYALSFVEWFAGESTRIYGDVLPQTRDDQRLLALRQPVGVCAAITAWNFPAALVTRKVAPALAAGCTVVLKPAEQTPFSAIALAGLAHQAGVPEAAFSVVTGRATEIGPELTGNPIIRKLTFTGSTATGRLLMAQCAPTVKRLSLELGGNAPFIVFDDADINKAVQGLMQSKFRSTGQTCVCANRVFVQDAVYDAFARRLAESVGKLRVGDGFEDGVDQGPLIDDKAVAKVDRLVKGARDSGAKILVGGTPHALGGRFYSPTIIGDVNASMELFSEEIFGPVVSLIRFAEEAEAITMANSTEVGLAGYFFSRDIGRVWRVAEALEVGMVGVNTGMLSNEIGPFGGVKQSGFGREGSRYGLEEFTELKYLCLGDM